MQKYVFPSNIIRPPLILCKTSKPQLWLTQSHVQIDCCRESKIEHQSLAVFREQELELNSSVSFAAFSS